ncbi:MAG: GspH/FimT family pseudopilin [Pseudomonadota bacterium]|nr:prepilin-type N-terminal cleavage/methylation domain-containing protein [Gammaproteobacteria bacterium]MBU1558897.1 prepilin-type N-terminal cleavage/methylation domain-containing protein [Gammaproteobacteria bacterium]MBU1628818.1 prepilin-type N-terminal cleavage/methylation domain-containing protein [Gammaproteobacteria bacterium]MBU1926607.1 prepilin-type N-terminal cleavage/methylation domain-containing protein [Gammaproteobacteria bacterium]MBU2545832.1 prepilin-type N-terminal cleavag
MDISSKASGFSFIELVIVVAIIGILSVVAILNWPSNTVLLDAQTAVVAHDIRYAQSLSMAKNQRFRFVRISSSSYQIQDSSGTPQYLPAGGTTVNLGSGISFGSFTNLPNNLIAFDTEGIPYVTTGSPGTKLTSTAIVRVVSGGVTRTISISPDTGDVSL